MMLDRQTYEAEEAERLAPYASAAVHSLGRLEEEAEHEYRTAFQRDRDRIVHSHAFRRLEYKTQVFIFHEGDHYRNRLTHTLEASQIARTCARALRANEDLAEAIVLAHDLGHTPFGHAGEHALARLMASDGGFDHNRQTLRIVDWLEERYPDFRGLNLTTETREGILKHGCSWDHPRPVPDSATDPSLNPSLEAQLGDASDEIAYLNHDLDDGLRSGLLTLDQLEGLTLWAQARERAEERYGPLPERIRAAATITALINRLSSGLVEETAGRLAEWGCTSAAALRAEKRRAVGYAKDLDGLRLELREFLFDNLYYSPTVVRMSRKAERILTDLFEVYRGETRLLPGRVREAFGAEGEARAIADYVAGMTDRFAMAEHRKLFDPGAPG